MHGLPSDLVTLLKYTQAWLPPTSWPQSEPRRAVEGALLSIILDRDTPRFGAALSEDYYRQLRRLLSSPLSQHVRLAAVLLLHSVHEPDDLDVQQALISLMMEDDLAQVRHMNTLFPDVAAFSEWMPAAGPPWPGSRLMPQLWDSPFMQEAPLLLVLAGLGSTARTHAFSGDGAATAALAPLLVVIDRFGRAPPTWSGTAQHIFQAWVSYTDLLLRGVSSPVELDEDRCSFALHCLICAATMMEADNFYRLALKLVDLGVELFTRDMPVLLDVIALHPEWTLYGSRTNSHSR